VWTKSGVKWRQVKQGEYGTVVDMQVHDAVKCGIDVQSDYVYFTYSSTYRERYLDSPNYDLTFRHAGWGWDHWYGSLPGDILRALARVPLAT